MGELSKFDELRLKTERQLVQLIDSELGLGVRHARQALRSADTWGVAEECYSKAKRAYAEASRLIPLVGERGRWEARLAHLGEMLEGLSVLAAARAPAGDRVPVLARALWKARGCPEGSPEDDWFRAESVLKAQSGSSAACWAS
jgi:hypothetical protein